MPSASIRSAGEPIPRYRQIAERLRAEIASGIRGPGARLPTIRGLAAELGVNRDTVALAYEELGAAGLIASTVGRGTFVRGGRGSGPAPERFAPRFSERLERIVGFDRHRPRYPGSEDAIPLHALVPDPALYPVAAFRRSLSRVLARRGEELLRYGTPQGHAGLRATLAKRLDAVGVATTSDAIALTQGASEGISLALRLFTDPGDSVAVEEPTYHNVLASLAALGLRAAPVPMRDGAADLAALERTLARPDVKLFYTMPTFHNPLGTSSSVAHREEVLVLAARAHRPVVEDAYEMDLRYSGRPVPSLAALDRHGLVVQLCSFSKSLFPGVRVGCIVAPPAAIEPLLALKHATDLGGALVLQAALADFVESGAYDRHLVKLRKTLLARRDAMLDALARDLPAGTTFTVPEGGHQVWVELPHGLDTRDLLADAARAGVLFAPGYQFHHDGRPSSGLRLSLALADEGAIRRGVAALGRVAHQRIGEARGVRRHESVHV